MSRVTRWALLAFTAGLLAPRGWQPPLYLVCGSLLVVIYGTMAFFGIMGWWHHRQWQHEQDDEIIEAHTHVEPIPSYPTGYPHRYPLQRQGRPVKDDPQA